MSKPLGPYTPVVRAGDFVIVSGQGGMRDGVKVDGGVRAETVQTMQNVAAQLATVGASLSDVVKTTCFLTDMENFAVVQRGLRRGARFAPPRSFDGGRRGAAGQLPRRGRGLGLRSAGVIVTALAATGR